VLEPSIPQMVSKQVIVLFVLIIKPPPANTLVDDLFVILVTIKSISIVIIKLFEYTVSAEDGRLIDGE
jgi:hypothetical protein